jgi:NADH-quinone oxidoreductase subunit N
MPYLLFLAIMLFIAALGVETALFPFNLWVPDVYQGAPGFVTAMMAGVNKKVAFVALIEILFVLLIGFKGTFAPILAALSILTMFFGNLLAMVQDNVKRMFAYSSISQAGYILIGMAAATQYGITASLFQIITHAFMIIGAFSIVMWLESKNMHTIDDYSGLFRSNGFAAVSLTIFMLSMAGIPPLMGFYGKFLLFSSAAGSNLLYLAVIGIINSFISIYYYGKVISSVFIKREKRKERMPRGVMVAAGLLVLAIIVFGAYPQPVLHLASLAASALYQI